MKLIAGNSTPRLAEDIAQFLGIPLAATTITRFLDNEVSVEITETVRGEDVFVIQSTSFPTNDHVMELLVILDALKRGSARRVTAVIPYYGYARQDRKSGPRTPISAKLVADLLTVAGAHRVLTLDLHSGQIQGFFNIPVDNFTAAGIFHKDILKNYDVGSCTLVAPDVGGVYRARAIARLLNVDLAIVDKRRAAPGVSEVVNIIGDVKDKQCVLIDDMIDSGGTICHAAEALIRAGARDVLAYATHGVLSGEAIDRIQRSSLSSVVVTDSIHPTEDIKACSKIQILSLAPLIGEAIHRISEERSVSSMFI